MKRALLLQSAGLKLAGIWMVLGTGRLIPGGLVFLSGGALVAAHMLIPKAQGLCDVVTSFRTRKREVWLTVDDGPDPEDTPRILDLLDTHRARATFFLVGHRAAEHPALVREILARGHSVGSHSHTHPLADFWLAGPERVRRELDESVAVLDRLGARVRLFRPPVGIKNLFLDRLLRERGLHCVGWTVRGMDGSSRNREGVIRRILKRVQPGCIILLHEGKSVAPDVRVQALSAVLEGLEQRGLRCVLPDHRDFVCGSGALARGPAVEADRRDQPVVAVGPADQPEKDIAPAKAEAQTGVAGDN